MARKTEKGGHEISNWGREAIEKDVEHAICIFSEKLISERRKGN